MSPERWSQVAGIFEKAQELPANARGGFLDEACAADAALRREVEEMLRCHEASGDFLDKPVLQTTEISHSSSLEKIAHFKILEKLGEGGMGTVYKAEDLTLGRVVAVKVLNRRLAGKEEARRRFLREARAASALDHPNICTVFEVEESEDGRLAIVMAYYDGETLRQRLARGPLAPRDALRLMHQAASGLARAHEAGIVHRDVKPANLMLTRDGILKILDFGIAKMGEADSLTGAGSQLGTVAYMAPEQARGETIDFRVDVWALGVVFYELLTGANPFRRENHLATMNAILFEDPAPVPAAPGENSLQLWPVIARALHKDPTQRYHTMGEFAAVLEAMRDTSDSASALQAFQELRPAPSVLVLPFSNLSADPENEFLSDGLTEELIHALNQCEGLRVISRGASFHYKGASVDPCEIGKKMQVATVASGAVRRSGSRVRVTAQLVNVADGFNLWTGRFDREMTDIIELEDDIAQAIAGSLAKRLQPDESRASVRTPVRPEAYELYMRGRFHLNQWTPASIERAIRFFEQTIAIDASLAMAHHGIARAILLQAILGFARPLDILPAALEAAQRAVSLQPGRAELLAAAAIVHGLLHNDWPAARAALTAAHEQQPDEQLLREWYCEIVLLPQGRFDEALQLVLEDRKLREDSAPVRLGAAWLPLWSARPDEAVETADRLLSLAPAILTPYWIKSFAWEQKQQFDRVSETLRAALQIDPTSTVTQGMLARALVLEDKRGEALDAIEFLDSMRAGRYVAPTHLSWAHIALGDFDRAFQLLEQAVEERDFLVIYLDSFPIYQPLRQDPRCAALRKKLCLQGPS